MIAFASMRTDIPAFYSQWLLKRMEEGVVMVRSPYGKNLVYSLDFNPKTIDCLGICTKDPGKLIPHLSAFRNWNTLWHVTITPYSREYEPGIQDKRSIVEAFRNLSLRVGKERVVWRYDPVFLSPSFPLSSHKAWFATLSSLLEGYTDRVVFSFLDIYPHIKERLETMEIKPPSRSEAEELARFFVQEGRRHKMEVSSCAEGFWMEEYGVETAGCFTKDVWEKCCGKRLNIPKTKGKRKDCSCILGFDLGGYGGCRMDCVYCYGRGDERREGHNPLSPLLFGWPGKNDEIRKVKAESWIDGEGWLL